MPKCTLTFFFDPLLSSGTSIEIGSFPKLVPGFSGRFFISPWIREVYPPGPTAFERLDDPHPFLTHFPQAMGLLWMHITLYEPSVTLSSHPLPGLPPVRENGSFVHIFPILKYHGISVDRVFPITPPSSPHYRIKW